MILERAAMVGEKRLMPRNACKYENHRILRLCIVEDQLNPKGVGRLVEITNNSV